MRMKRKDLDGVYDEFSEFALDSPAAKIRKMDAELPLMIEEEEPSFSASFSQISSPMEQIYGSRMSEIGSEMFETEPSVNLNGDRALVLYNPMENPPVLSSSSFRVHPDLIHGLKSANQNFWTGRSNPVRIEEVAEDDMRNGSGNSLAVVSWAPSLDSCQSRGVIVEEPMEEEEEEEQGGAAMEVEEDVQQTTIIGEGLRQWPQHCMNPQIPPNPFAPIMWS